MQIVWTQPLHTTKKDRVICAFGCTAVYFAVAGTLCSMAGLGWSLLGMWAAGACLLLALCFLPQRKRIQLAVRLSLLLLFGISVLFLWDALRDGVCLLLNRLFAASELQQAYLYERLPVYAQQADRAGCLRTAALLLGLLLAQLLTLPGCFGRALALLASCGAMAYLGVSPERGWLIALAASLLLTILPQSSARQPRQMLPIAAAFLLLAALCLLSPAEENVQLSAWEEHARDSLALQTAAYGEASARQDVSEEQAPQNGSALFRQEPMQSTLNGDRQPLSKPLRAVIVIVLLLLALFLPAVYQDRLKRRREQNRTGLSDADARRDICASFHYLLRWLRLAGLKPENVPFAHYAEQIKTLFGEEISGQYLQILPIWQEAAYSTHPMNESQRTQMHTFLQTVTSLVWKQLSRTRRLWVKYWLAL